MVVDTPLKYSYGLSNEPESGMGKKADTQNRSLRIQNLRHSTQDPSTREGLLQQTFEKYASVTRVQLHADRNEAIVEFNSAAVGTFYWFHASVF